MSKIVTSKDSMTDLLRVVYAEEMMEHFARRSVLLSEVPRQNVVSMGEGKGITVKAHVAGGGGFQFARNLETAPPSKQNVRQMVYNYKLITAQLEIAANLMLETSKGMAAEKDILDLEIPGVAKDSGPLMNFLMYGDGSGTMAAVSSVTDSTTMIVDSARGIQENMRVDVMLTAGEDTVGYGVAGAKIAVNYATNTITLLEGATFTDYAGLDSNSGDYTVYISNGRNNSINGLASLIDNANPPSGVSNIGGIDRDLAINAWFHAQVFHNGGNPRRITLPMIQDAVDAIDNYADGDAKLILCGNRVWTQIAADLVGNKAYGGELMKLHGWASAVNFVNTPIVRDMHCPPDKMFILDPANLKILQSSEGQWMDDGAILRKVPGRIAFEATWWKECEFICLKPRACAVIKDLATDLAEG